jgi:glutamate formiminotransferase
MPLLEAVPNVSEGRDAATVGALRDALGAESGVVLLDVASDPDHHRTVLTAAGEPGPLQRGLLSMTREAAARIDLRRHAGVHPRLGAVDVVPFVPLGAATMADAVEAAHRLGEAIGEDLAIPVFLYGEAASDAGRRLPAGLRRRGLAAVAAELEAGALRPDYGPCRAHPTAGVTLVGARTFLVAFNLWLATDDVRAAREIARAIRERDGGLPGVQALGFYLATRGRAQVSINLLRPDATPLPAVVARVRELAAARGIEVERGELIGLLPEAIASRTTARALLLPELGRDQILEHALARLFRR